MSSPPVQSTPTVPDDPAIIQVCLFRIDWAYFFMHLLQGNANVS